MCTQGTGNCWHGWVGLLLCSGPRSQPLGNCFFLEILTMEVFLWQVILFLYKPCFKSQFPERVQYWIVSLLTAPKTAFPESPLLQTASLPAISHPTWDPLIFWFSSAYPTAKSLTKALQAESVSHEMAQSSCDMQRAITYAMLSTVSGLLLILISHDYSSILSKISSDTSTGIHLWTWHIMTQLSVAR